MNLNKIWKKRQLKKILRSSSSPFARLKLASNLSTIILFLVIGSILLTTFLFAWYAKDLPHPDKIKRTEGFSTIIYDRNGKVLYDVYADQNRIPIKLNDIPKNLKNATIAIEDKDFYEHGGFDPKGMLRAVFNIVFRGSLQGGSTLTQQLVKNVLLTSERTIGRKIKEFILAVQIERKYNKDQILQMYLNEAPYGGTAWGVETAAQVYFGKNAKDLNLLESAILAGFPQRPTAYSPYGSDPKAYIWRTKQVLRRMREDKYITRDKEKQTLIELEKIKFTPQKTSIKAPHFVMYVKQLLVEKFGERMVERGGLKVITSLDLELQTKAQKIVANEIKKVEAQKITNGAAVVMDPDSGEILAMVGSKDYFAKNYDGNVNVALSLRQPGSSIKPVTYATALKKGYTASTVLFDAKTIFPSQGGKDYIPVNYDGKYHGPMQLRFALGNSINLAAVKMLAMIGIKDMLDTAYQMGLVSLEPTEENLKRFGLAITLGGGEVRLLDMSSAYSAFANGGYQTQPVSILKVKDTKGKTLFKHKKMKKKRVIGQDITFIISHILMDENARAMTFGRGSYLYIPDRQVAVKTGTTDDKRDNWTIGWSPNIIVGVWVGNNDNSPMGQVASGTSGASPIWNRIIKAALNNLPKETFEKPDNVIAEQIDSLGGGLPTEGQSKRSEYFIKGTEPTGKSAIYKTLKISKAQPDKLANEIEIKSGEYEKKDYIVFTEKDPVSTDGKNRWQEGINSFLNSIEPYKSDSKYHPPSQTSTAKENEVAIKIKKPENHQKIDSNDVKIEAQAFSLQEIVKIIIEVDDSQEYSTNNNSVSTYVNLTNGPHTIKVKAQDSRGNEGESEIKIGVKTDWDFKEPTPTPEPTEEPSPTPTFTPSPTPTPA